MPVYTQAYWLQAPINPLNATTLRWGDYLGAQYDAASRTVYIAGMYCNTVGAVQMCRPAGFCSDAWRGGCTCVLLAGRCLECMYMGLRPWEIAHKPTERFPCICPCLVTQTKSFNVGGVSSWDNVEVAIGQISHGELVPRIK